MALRLIQTEQYKERKVRIFFDRDLSEYIVVLYINGVHKVSADYFTGDEGDAKGTANTMLKYGQTD